MQDLSMKILMVLVLLCSLNANAELLFARIDRESTVGTNLTLGKDFSSLDLFGNIGLSEIWRLSLRGTETKSAALISKEFRIGADVKVGELFLPRMGLLTRQEPGDIRGGGMTLGFDYELQSLWQGELKTHFIFDLESIRYTQGARVAARRLRPEEVLNQASTTFSIGQELGKGWSTLLSVTGFSYDQDPELWSEAVSARFWETHSLEVPIMGFPRSASQLQIEWAPFATATFGLGVSSSKGAFGSIVRGSNLTSTVTVGDHWILDGWLASSRTDGVADSSIIGIGAEYIF